MNTPAARIVVLDTSFFLGLARHRREVDWEIQDATAQRVMLATSDGVVMELQRLARSEKSSKTLAKIGLSILESKGVEVIETNPAVPEVDIGIATMALEDKRRVDVATVDRRLRQNLTKLGISVMGLRSKGGVWLQSAATRVP